VEPLKRAPGPFGPGKEHQPLRLVAGRTALSKHLRRARRLLRELAGVDPGEGPRRVAGGDLSGEQRPFRSGALNGLGLLAERVGRQGPGAAATRGGEGQEEGD
jgi:hypothetical protein